MWTYRVKSKYLAAFASGLFFAFPATVFGQGSLRPAVNPSRPGARTETLPRTPWGDPDLQGIWTNNAESSTPFERPAEMGTRSELNNEEFAKRVAEVKDHNNALEGQLFYDVLKGLPSRATSLVIDPPDGRIPPYTLEGKRRVEAAAEASRSNNVQLPQNTLAFGVGERCISRTLPGAGAPRAYDNFRHIFQTKNHVAILYEMIHDARVIPLDGRVNESSDIRMWMGRSHGHWEGNTLVLEVTKFQDRISFNGVPGTANEIPVSSEARIVERYTLVKPGMIEYKATVDDPGTFTKPWTFKMDLFRDSEQTQILEYACHEGNYNTMTTALSGGRAEEAKAKLK